MTIASTHGTLNVVIQSSARYDQTNTQQFDLLSIM